MIFEEQVALEPDHYPWAQQFIAVMQDGLWNDRRFSFQGDIQDFKVNLTEQERGIITRSLSAIAQIEVPMKRFWAKLGDTLPHPSLIDLGTTMAYIEVVHGNAYRRLLKELGLNQVFKENLKLDLISGRVNYLRKYVHKYYKDSKKQFVYALILFTLFVENVSLFSQFYVINWLNRTRNVLKDTSQQVAYTAREEMCHALAGIQLINEIRKELPELFDEELIEKILHEAKESVKFECKINEWTIGDYSGVGHKGEKLDAQTLNEQLKQRMNESLAQIKFPQIFEVDQEILKGALWFDEDVLGETKTDFFHKKPVEYTKDDQSFDDADDLFG